METPKDTKDAKDAKDTEQETPSTTEGKRLTKKQLRQRAQRRQLFSFLSLVAVVALIIAGIVYYNSWNSTRGASLPADHIMPADQVITAVVNGKEIPITPYSACELDAKDCPGGTPFSLDLAGAQDFTLKIPEDVSNHDWLLLGIYDDPGANTEQYFTANEASEVTLNRLSTQKSEDGSIPKLVVVEIQSLLIGVDKDGKQSPFNSIWSIAVQESS